MKIIFALIFSLLFICPALAQTDVEQNGKKVGITFSFPWINNYRFVDYEKKKEAKKFGFFGLGFGIYYKKNETKVSFNLSTTDDLASPIAQINYNKSSPQTDIRASFGELLYQHPIHDNFYFMGGVNLMSYRFLFSSGTDSIPSYAKNDNTLGLTLGLEYHFDKHFSVAAVYRPSVASFETDSYYRHLITIELRIDIDVKKLKHL